MSSNYTTIVMKTKLQIIEDFFERVWSQGDSDIIRKVFVPDGDDQKTAAGLAREAKLSPEDFIAFQQALLGLVPSLKISIVQHAEDGDWLIVRCVVDATSSAGQPVQMTGTAWARITDGKIREAYNYFDFLHFFEGLGLLPEDTLSKCLSGIVVH